MNHFYVQIVMTIFHTLFLKRRFFVLFAFLYFLCRNSECLQKELGRLFRIIVYFSLFDAKMFLSCKVFKEEEEEEEDDDVDDEDEVEIKRSSMFNQ